MDIKSVMVAVDYTPGCEARIRLAADLCDRFQARLLGCAGVAPIGQLGFPPLDPTVGSVLVTDESDHLAAAETTFRRIAGSRTSAWAAEQRPLNEVILRRAFDADLIVLGTPEPGGDASRQADPSVLLMEAGVPLMLAPAGRDHVHLHRMFVCWKDTAECRRAVQDALPLLRQAEDVMIAQVAQKSDLRRACAHGSEVVEALARHGVTAVSEVLVHDEHRTVDLLKRRAGLLGADMIIAGGYGRSRLGEQVFGGVTRSLLTAQLDRPVFISR